MRHLDELCKNYDGDPKWIFSVLQIDGSSDEEELTSDEEDKFDAETLSGNNLPDILYNEVNLAEIPHIDSPAVEFDMDVDVLPEQPVTYIVFAKWDQPVLNNLKLYRFATCCTHITGNKCWNRILCHNCSSRNSYW